MKKNLLVLVMALLGVAFTVNAQDFWLGNFEDGNNYFFGDDNNPVIMDIVEKLNRILMDTTCHAQGSVDTSQGPYGSNIMGMRYRKKKKKMKGGAEYAMHEGKYWPGHRKWDPYHGTGVKPPKPTLQNKMSRDKDISAIKSFIEKQRTWFDIEEVGDGFILLSTREHGDVGSGRAGKEDQKEGIRLGKLIKQKFKTVDIDLDGFDEWVHLEIRL